MRLAEPCRFMRRAWFALFGTAAAAAALLLVPFEYALVPSAARCANESPAFPHPADDVWGESASSSDAQQPGSDATAAALPSAATGAVHIDDGLLALGRSAFYEETFGNEAFLTDVLGIIDGPLGLPQFGEALLRLHGRVTTNLRVRIAYDTVVGGRAFKRGELVDTGLDVPRGALVPLGMAIRRRAGKVRIGITCAACHSTVDQRTGLVIHGAPNGDLEAGLLLALASNSASYFPHVAVGSLSNFIGARSASVRDTHGRRAQLPEPERLERAVDAMLLQWPPGSFDSMVDLVAAPTQLPDSFTFEDYPFNWSGAFMAGPFHGLSVQSNNVHALNADPFTHADSSEALFGVDKEVYLGTLLQRAASAKFRFDPTGQRTPSEFFDLIDPTPGAPAMNEVVPLPTYPKASLIAPDGLWSSSPGMLVWQQVNAMSAWQNTLVPPPPATARSAALFDRGRAVFERAACDRCHTGPGFNNHRIIAVEELGTEPARAHALHDTEKIFVAPVALAFDQKVPLPSPARQLAVPTDKLDRAQIELAFAHGQSQGGYKVPGLLGLNWSAPYLHDGGVAVGPDPATQAGLAKTLLVHVMPDPAQSLRALLDRELRARVVSANDAVARLRGMHVRGVGHEFWVDAAAGFDADDQRALIHYLLHLH